MIDDALKITLDKIHKPTEIEPLDVQEIIELSSNNLWEKINLTNPVES